MKELDLKKLRQLANAKDENTLDNFLSAVAEHSHQENFLQHFYEAVKKNILSLTGDFITYTATMVCDGKRKDKICKQDRNIAFQLYLIAADKKYELACRNVAFCYFNGLGIETNLDEAEQYCRKSITESLNPQHRVRNVLLGKILFQKEEFNQAEECFKKIKPEDKAHFAEAKYYLGRINAKEYKKYEIAINYFKSIDATYKAIYEDALNKIKILRETAIKSFEAKKKAKEAVDPNSKEILEAISDDSAYVVLAEIADYEGNPKQAFTWLNKVSLQYADITKVWDFKKKLLKEKLNEIFLQKPENNFTVEEEKTEIPEAALQSKDIEIFVKDTRWINISENLDGFTGNDLEEYPKLNHYFTQEDRFETSINDLREKLDLVKEQIQSLKKYPEKKDEIKNNLETHQTELEEKIQDLKNQEKKRKSYKRKWEGLTTVEEKRKKRIRATEERFFNPAREKRSETSRQFIESTAHHLLDNRYAESNEKVIPIAADHQPARRLITAEKAILMSSSKCGQSAGWKSNDKNKEGWDANFTKGYNFFSNHETITMENDNITIQYKQRTDPKSQRPGDAKVLEIGNYRAIYGIIWSICQEDEDKERMLAELMRKYSCEGRAIKDKDIAEIIKINNHVVSTDENSSNAENNHEVMISEDIHHKTLYLNRACFLAFVKEPTEWFESSDKDRQYEWLTAQARAMQLLCEGYLRMCDVFNSDSPYGVFTGTSLIQSEKQIAIKIQNIHRLYEKRLERKEDITTMSFFRDHKHSSAQVLATRKQHRKELQYLYGGESDTDGEGYESEGNEMTFKLPIVG